MNTTRENIIHTLLKHPGSTINELAEVVGINGISVRHHLTNLQAEDIVTTQEQRHGVGRPRMVYMLTEKGMERFPTNYLRLTNRILEQVKQVLPEEEIKKLFSNMAANLVASYKKDLANLPIEQQLDYVKDTLLKEGFIIEWERSGENYIIRNVSCPYYHVGLNHPEICNIDRTIISTLLNKKLRINECVLNGKSCCSYVIESKNNPHDRE